MCVQLEEALTLSQRVVSAGEDAGELLPRAYLCVGLCYSLKASEGKLTNNTRVLAVSPQTIIVKKTISSRPNNLGRLYRVPQRAAAMHP